MPHFWLYIFQTACNRTEGGYSNPDSSQMSANSFWRKAEAYHFWMLAQRQLYEGQFEYASRTSLILEEYEDVIGHTQTQSLIAMASYCCRNFSRCSRSLMRLGRLDACMRPKIQHFPNTTTSIFSQARMLLLFSGSWIVDMIFVSSDPTQSIYQHTIQQIKIPAQSSRSCTSRRVLALWWWITCVLPAAGKKYFPNDWNFAACNWNLPEYHVLTLYDGNLAPALIPKLAKHAIAEASLLNCKLVLRVLFVILSCCHDVQNI